ncbi:MAG: hypothetical protein KGV43_02835 [Arcobacter sp.]|nr:hypothetical protein [Arcobacter sp.]
MILKKTSEIIKLENDLKKAKQKQKEQLQIVNNKAMNLILKKIGKDKDFIEKFKLFLDENNLSKVYELLADTYEVEKEKNE